MPQHVQLVWECALALAIEMPHMQWMTLRMHACMPGVAIWILNYTVSGVFSLHKASTCTVHVPYG